VAEPYKASTDSTSARLDTSWNVSRVLSDASKQPVLSHREINESLKSLAPPQEKPRFMESSLQDLVGLKVGVKGGKFSVGLGEQGGAEFNLPKDIGLGFNYSKEKRPWGGSGYDWNLQLSKPVKMDFWRK